MASSSRSLFIGSIFILQPMYDKASCRDSGITSIYTIYTLKLLVTYIFLARSSSRTGVAGVGFFFFYPPLKLSTLEKFSCSQTVISKLEGCPPAATIKLKFSAVSPYFTQFQCFWGTALRYSTLLPHSTQLID